MVIKNQCTGMKGNIFIYLEINMTIHPSGIAEHLILGYRILPSLPSVIFWRQSLYDSNAERYSDRDGAA